MGWLDNFQIGLPVLANPPNSDTIVSSTTLNSNDSESKIGISASSSSSSKDFRKRSFNSIHTTDTIPSTNPSSTLNSYYVFDFFKDLYPSLLNSFYSNDEIKKEINDNIETDVNSEKSLRFPSFFFNYLGYSQPASLSSPMTIDIQNRTIFGYDCPNDSSICNILSVSIPLFTTIILFMLFPLYLIFNKLLKRNNIYRRHISRNSGILIAQKRAAETFAVYSEIGEAVEASLEQLDKNNDDLLSYNSFSDEKSDIDSGSVLDPKVENQNNLSNNLIDKYGGMISLFYMGGSDISLGSDFADTSLQVIKGDYSGSFYVRFMKTFFFLMIFIFGVLISELRDLQRDNFSSYSIYDPFYQLPVPRIRFVAPSSLVPHEHVSLSHLDKLMDYLDTLSPVIRLPIPVVTQTIPRVILDGHHRVASSLRLNLSLIPVWEVDDSDEFKNWKTTFVRVYSRKGRIRLKDVVRGARNGVVEFGIKGTKHVAVVGQDGREEPLERVTPRVPWGLWRLGNVKDIRDIATEENGDMVILTTAEKLPKLLKDSEYLKSLNGTEENSEADPDSVVYDSEGQDECSKFDGDDEERERKEDDDVDYDDDASKITDSKVKENIDLKNKIKEKDTNNNCNDKETCNKYKNQNKSNKNEDLSNCRKLNQL